MVLDPEVIVRQRLERGSLLDRLLFRPLGRLFDLMPGFLPVTCVVIAGLIAIRAFQAGDELKGTALAAMLVYLGALPTVARVELGLLARRRLFLFRRVVEAALPIAAAHACGELPLGFIAAVCLNAFAYSATSFVVEIPAPRRAASPESVKALDRALLAAPQLWPVGAEFLLLVLGAAVYAGHARAALLLMACAPAALFVQWVLAWREIGVPASPGRPITPADFDRLKAALGKGRDGPVSRLLNRPVSLRVTRLVARVGFTPNAATVIAAGCGVAAALLLARGWFVAGAVLVHLHSVLDGVDGELARLGDRASYLGAWFDRIGDMLGEYAIFLGIAWGTGEWAWAVAGFLGNVLAVSAGDTLTAMGLLLTPAWQPQKTVLPRIAPWIGRDVMLFALAILCLCGHPALFFPLLLVARLPYVVLQSLLVLAVMRKAPGIR